ncbi:MAG: mannitol dehydrogenase family protein [Lachnospiraceae bacterium]|nr:mannitol dehydrogenase family protein [Lachnospiraceae bacterium]
MRLTDLSSNFDAAKKEFEANGIEVFNYDRNELRKKTMENPTWLHFGAGNIFRAFPARVLDELLSKGICQSGLIVCEGFDEELIDKAYKPFDDLSLAVTLCANGEIKKQAVGSVVESVFLGTESGYNRISDIFTKESLQFISFTITEKGYSLMGKDGNLMGLVKEDLESATLLPRHLMGKIAALLLKRYNANKAPLAVVSMDNCSHNGDKLKASVMVFANNWVDKGVVDKGFVEYLEDANKITFPLSMIDKITPRPDALVGKALEDAGFNDTDVIITSKNTYTSPFVNAEETEYLVIEDRFPNGRMALEKGGILFTDRETVDKVEKMKVCTCLNPLHTCLAIFGCLLDYKSISAEMSNPLLVKMITKLGYEEGMPVVVNPGILNPVDFLKNVIEKRLPNPFMPDTPQRIACDTSQKIPVRFGETLKAYKAKGDIPKLNVIPLVFAGYLRYLLGTNDNGEAFEPSPDPLLSELMNIMNTSISEMDQAVNVILSRKDIFAIDLFDCGIAKQVKELFAEMCAGKGAITRTLEKYL